MPSIHRKAVDLVFDLLHYHGAIVLNDGKPPRGDPTKWRYHRLLGRVLDLVDAGLKAENL